MDQVKKYVENQIDSFINRTNGGISLKYEVHVIEMTEYIRKGDPFDINIGSELVTKAIRQTIQSNDYSTYIKSIDYFMSHFPISDNDRIREIRFGYHSLRVTNSEISSTAFHITLSDKLYYLSPPFVYYDDKIKGFYVFVLSFDERQVKINSFWSRLLSVFVAWFRGMDIPEITRKSYDEMILFSTKMYFNSHCHASYSKDDLGINTYEYIMSDYLNDIYSIVNQVSSMKYEGNSTRGTILIIPIDHMKKINFYYKLETTIDLCSTSLKVLRKLIEISSPELPLIIDGLYVYGFGTSEDIEVNYTIQILDNQKWEFNINENGVSTNVFVIEKSQVKLNNIPVSFDKFSSILNVVFSSVDYIDTELLYNIFKSAIQQKHGTMLVFLEEAETESLRLSNSSFKIKGNGKIDFIRNITSIDGALLFDCKGKMYSFGTILDGISMAFSNEDKSRGARFNSAIKYTQTINQKCLVIVISEDGYIDFITKGNTINI